MGDPVHPGPERAPPLELFETQPQGQMNLLKKIALTVHVDLICSGQPSQSSAIRRNSLLIETVLAPHIQIVAGIKENVTGFLQFGRQKDFAAPGIGDWTSV